MIKGDRENYAKCWDKTEKLQLLHPEIGQWLKGWNEFSPVCKRIFESDYLYSEYENELLNVNISKDGNMAWTNAKVIWSINNSDKKNRMWYACAFEKVDGEWKIVMGMVCGVPNAD